MMSATCLIEPTTCCMVAPAWSTSAVPCSTRSTLALMRVLTARAASALRCARLRTSLATTAKPRPCSPARAASTAALSARMLVWKAMPSITPMMSAILRELSLMPFMVSTTWPTTSPPLTAMLLAPSANALAWRALSALWRTVAPSCSIDAAVCCSVEACSSVRWLRSWLPWAICALAVATLSAFMRTAPTTFTRLSCMRPIWAIRLLSSPARNCTVTLRSPAATRWASAATSAGSAPSWRVMETVTRQPSSSAAAAPARVQPINSHCVCA